MNCFNNTLKNIFGSVGISIASLVELSILNGGGDRYTPFENAVGKMHFLMVAQKKYIIFHYVWF